LIRHGASINDAEHLCNHGRVGVGAANGVGSFHELRELMAGRCGKDAMGRRRNVEQMQLGAATGLRVGLLHFAELANFA